MIIIIIIILHHQSIFNSIKLIKNYRNPQKNNKFYNSPTTYNTKYRENLFIFFLWFIFRNMESNAPINNYSKSLPNTTTTSKQSSAKLKEKKIEKTNEVEGWL